MPISSDEFKKGYTETALKDSVEKLLKDCKAWTKTEIQRALNANLSFTESSDATFLKVLDAAITVLSFGMVLDSMVSEGKLESRYVETANGSEKYYIKKSCIG